ncbi:MAG: 16S rRNA (guanine(966)-N(2))-methyltransferase RsmD [Butyricicoccus sp.]
MRVISGSARGCKLQPVPGMNTRPTTDRVKESVFNIIQNEIRGARVLDLFAGTGQLGIETLSRGAASCDFVDHNRQALEVIRKNIAAARVGDRARVHSSEAAAFVSRCGKGQYDLILLDPPYGGKILNDALFVINRFDILAPSGIILCESALEDVFDAPLAPGREYRYGATRITVFRNQQTERAEL